MRWLPAFAVLELATVVAVLTASAPARAEPAGTPSAGRFGVRLPDVPAYEADDPRALSSIIAVLRPGMVIHRVIQVVNEEPHPATFAVYADAAQISDGFFIGAAGAARNELTTWVSVRHPVIRLGPDTSATEKVTIAVPRIATRGQHYGVIWVQQAAAVHPHQGVTIREINRVGIRMYVTISHGAAPVNFTVGSLTARLTAAGQPEIVAHVSNTGGQAVDVNGTARLANGPGGTSAATLVAQRVLTLAPGQSGDIVFLASHGLPAGPWHVRLTLASGLTSRTASAVISFPATQRSGFRFLAWGSLLAGLAAAGTVIVRRTRLRRPRWR